MLNRSKIHIFYPQKKRYRYSTSKIVLRSLITQLKKNHRFVPTFPFLAAFCFSRSPSIGIPPLYLVAFFLAATTGASAAALRQVPWSLSGPSPGLRRALRRRRAPSRYATPSLPFLPCETKHPKP